MVDGEPKVEWVSKVNRWTGAETLDDHTEMNGQDIRCPSAPPRWRRSQLDFEWDEYIRNF